MIYVYTKKGCDYCVKLKNLFKEKNVKFTELDIVDDVYRRQMFKYLGKKEWG